MNLCYGHRHVDINSTYVLQIMFILFAGFCVVSIISLSFICKDVRTFLSLAKLNFKGTYWKILWNFDLVVLSILLMLFVCFGYAYFYTDHYFSNSIVGKELQVLICLFVGVMTSLVMTGDFLLTLIFWEYLGVVRFFLILFYLKYISLRASIVTLVSSRFGDVCLFILLAVSVFGGTNRVFSVIIFGLIILTKSASFPFISWLLEAMRAPTPVRSLVHSSTLVAAGVWFRLRYDIMLHTNKITPVLVILIITVLITGLCCLTFLDLKKIVALSTCKKISWCLIYLLLGDQLLCLFQLLRHGVSKCLLFMLVGDVMRGTGGSQASKCVYSSKLYGSWGIFSLFSIILGLSGAPFIGVFFTKHILLRLFFSVQRLTLFFVLMLCVLLSYLYSFRLCRVFYKINISVSRGVFFCFRSGAMVYFWLFIKFLLGRLLDETKFVTNLTSVLLLIFQLLACFTAWGFYKSDFSATWRSSLYGCDKLVESSIRLCNVAFNWILIFFYRWDRYMIQLFKFSNASFVKVYKQNLLKVLFLALLTSILMCLFIV